MRLSSAGSFGNGWNVVGIILNQRRYSRKPDDEVDSR
jgi:hypothetical protein